MEYLDITWDFIQGLISQFAGQIFQIILILIGLTILKKVGVGLLRRMFLFKIDRLKRTTPESLKQKETIKHMCLNIFSYAMSLLKAVLIISVFVPIGTFMAGLGAFAIVITFAFQNMLGDMVRGFFIIFEEMFMIGDFVEIAGFQGEVLEIGLRTTKLRQLGNDQIILIPNNNIGNIIRLNIECLTKEQA